MKKLITLVWVAFLFASIHTSNAQIYTTSSATLAFFSTARVENIEATNTKTSVVINTTTNEVMFKTSISGFVFKNGLMQEHFNENYMDSEQFPYAQFKGKINEVVNYKSIGEYAVTTTGMLTIHGVSVTRTIAGTLKVTATGITLASDFMVPVSDHKIDIPKDKISNIAQDIKVTVYAACIPYVKK
jgi:polyisoprenoid-binding protein YceI